VYLHPLEVERVATYLPQARSEAVASFFRRNGIPLEEFASVPSPGEIWAGLYSPTRPDRLIADGDRIRIGERELEVVWTPGHSPGHCVMYFRAEKTVIVGDHLLPKITPHVGIFADTPQDPLGDFLASLRKVGELDVENVLPAHGAVFHDHRRRVAQLLEFHDYRLEVMLDAIRSRPRTAYDIALEAFTLTRESPFQQQFPATFETLAHLEHLRRADRVRSVDRGNRIEWSVTSH
jgi:glyoxylase-like metal-dependent hydrolase (beta-lactamase superfamily II)